METTTATEVRKIFLQDIENLNDRHTYIVDRAKSTINGYTDLYDVLEIPENFMMILTITQSKNFIKNIFNHNNNQNTWNKSRISIINVNQLTSYSHIKEHVQLLTKENPIEYNTNEYHYNYGFVNVTVENIILVAFPQNHYGQTHNFPTSLHKRDEKFYFRTLGTEFDLLKFVQKYARRNDTDTKTTNVDHLIYNALIMWSSIEQNLQVKDLERGLMNELLRSFANNLKEMPFTFTEGIAKTVALIKPFYDNLQSTDFISALSVKKVADSCKSTVGGIKYSTVFNKLFADVKTQEEFDKKAFEISKLYVAKISRFSYDTTAFLTSVLDTLSEAREMKKAVLKRKSTGAFNKIMDDLEFIQIDKDKYPLSYAAVTNGEIPTSTFFRKSGESYFIYNDNWDIWEEILVEHKDIAIAIATEASKRTTYEKDIMSYFYFVLHSLPEYLEKNTGKKWKGIPKLVNSSNELDPPAEGSTGTVKTRSALTPIVDNEKSEIVVPYVSMQIGGYQTTYCYGLNYTVLQKGFSFNGNTVSKDVEENLNGRDNYGLMFYTLTGTAQGRGYPTFLIIFENMDKDKYGQNFRVHFHRTHPMRSKGGDYNPIHNWTKGCYKWMIGNVNYERIVAQQGDLAFVQIDEMPEGAYSEVDSYDSHCFSKPVKFTPYAKKEKQNILGYVELVEDVVLNHNEHLNRNIPKGVYEIRQCRSWEANPKGIWSLRID